MLMMSTARALSEACQLAYMSGQWVHTDCYGNTLIKIVESTLPGNGDYSAGVTSRKCPLLMVSVPVVDSVTICLPVSLLHPL